MDNEEVTYVTVDGTLALVVWIVWVEVGGLVWMTGDGLALEPWTG